MIQHFVLAFLVVICYVSCNLDQNCSNAQLSKTPQKFGILTMTYKRVMMEDPNQLINKYLTYYGNLDCDLYDNIYIVWNNNQKPEQQGFDLDSLKKKVIFIQTPYNSLGWKYLIPQTAQQQVLFTVDDDLYLKCSSLKEGFQKWQKESIGALGPLVSYSKRSFQFNKKKNSFEYQLNYNNMKKYHSMSLMNMAFVSRQYFDLFYSDFEQIKSIRKLVQKFQNCQDIAMNYILSYFYPQFLSRTLIGHSINVNQIQLNSKNNKKIKAIKGVSSTKSHIYKRHQCVNKFSQILSFNPLKYVSSSPTKMSRMNITCLILKKQEYYKNVIKHKTIQEIFEADKIYNPKLTAEQVAEIISEQLKQKEQLQKIEKQQQNKIESKNGLGQNNVSQSQKQENYSQIPLSLIILVLFLVCLMIIQCLVLCFQYKRLKNLPKQTKNKGQKHYVEVIADEILAYSSNFGSKFIPSISLQDQNFKEQERLKSNDENETQNDKKLAKQSQKE